MDRSQVIIKMSYGQGKGGKQFAYIRPKEDCFNRHRRVEYKSIDDCISKWFTPMNYYKVDGHIIGSNSEDNALKEYWRVCELSDAKEKKRFDVKLIDKIQ